MKNDDDSEPDSGLRQEAADLVGSIVDGVAGVPVVAVAKQVSRVLLGRSADTRVTAADAELAIQRAHEIPALECRVDSLGSMMTTLFESVSTLHARDQTNRLEVSASELTRLIAEGRFDSNELHESPELQRAVVESVRASLSAVAVEAIPFLARLAAEYRTAPVDRSFRSISRSLVALEPEDIERWVAFSHACRIAAHEGPVDLLVCLRANFGYTLVRPPDRDHWKPQDLAGPSDARSLFIDGLANAGVIRRRVSRTGHNEMGTVEGTVAMTLARIVGAVGSRDDIIGRHDPK